MLRDPARAARLGLRGLLFCRGLVHPLARLVGANGMARLASLVLEPDNSPGKKTAVLVLDRLYFEKDVDVLRRYGRMHYVTLHTHVLSVTQEAWLPEAAQIQVDYVLAEGPAAEAAWETCEDYAQKILDIARQRFGVKAVLASNVDYWQHEGFRRACAASDIPFLVLNQELQTVPAVYQLSLDMYARTTFRFNGTACAVFGQATADMLVESQVCAPHQVALTGAPRLDPWLMETLDAGVEQDSVVLLAFDGEQYFAPNCYIEALLAFAEASLRHPNLRFVLKAKDAEDAARSLAHLEGKDHRLVITHVEPLTALFPRSRLIIGYISIAVIEALLSRPVVAVPYWNDARKPAHEMNLDPDDALTQQHVTFLDSPDALLAAIEEVSRAPVGPGSMASRADLVYRFFHRPGEGGATAETEKFIDRHIGTAQ
ncbi:hypothetical protein [Devosia salina]|uniref:Glycosyltransferase family 1 protein n=1 Tax=Devosia salina TaxID=2860336 RepID=A0ABX8WFV2_9HYPH|nr:hypothetical protein [Devosia salina]QYO77774.1 hypothetical protein K1X15_04185 [Devosia salina]